MCVGAGGTYVPPECITFRTIRRALRQLREQITPGCHCAYCHYRAMPERRAPGLTGCLVDSNAVAWSAPIVRLAYVVGQLRTANNVDCDKAADFLLELFHGRDADRRDDGA